MLIAWRKWAARPAAFVAALAALGLTAALLVGWCTSRYDIGVSPDSAHYIGAARSLAAGQGLRFNGEPFTHWPPLYPLILAAAALTGVDPLQGARILAALLFAANTMLAASLAYCESGRSFYAGLCAGFVFLFSPEMLHIHTIAWSEPPFLCLSLAALLLFRRWRRELEPWLLAAVGLLVGLAALTRFVGVALLPSYLICIAVLKPAPVGARVGSALTLLGGAAAPIACWVLWHRTVRQATPDRPLVFHPPAAGLLLLSLLALGAVVVVVVAVQVRAHSQAGRRDLLPIWITTFLFTYFGFVVFSICFLDALTPLDGRILSPIYVFGTLLVVVWIWNANGQLRSRLWQAITTVALIVACLRVGAAILLARQRHDAGYGYTGRAWRASRALPWIDALPKGARIFSNSPELITFSNRRVARSLPTKFSPTSLLPNTGLDRDTEALRDELRHGALVIYFTGNPRSFLLSGANLESRHIPVLLRFPDAVIYGYKPVMSKRKRSSHAEQIGLRACAAITKDTARGPMASLPPPPEQRKPCA